jgi:hypothetical protein
LELLGTTDSGTTTQRADVTIQTISKNEKWKFGFSIGDLFHVMIA